MKNINALPIRGFKNLNQTDIKIIKREFPRIILRYIHKNSDFQKIVKSKTKEAGQSYANKVEELVIQALKNSIYGRYLSQEPHINGKVQKRPQADTLWKNAPFNVKLTFMEYGSPNMGSAKRLIKKLRENIISQYYIIYVMVDKDTKKVQVRIFDLLDNLNFIRIDAGPGQMMLDLKKFYTGPINQTKRLSLHEKMILLIKMKQAANNSKIIHLQKENKSYKRLDDAGFKKCSRTAKKVICELSMC
jgi:hypothetical protein